MKTIKMTKEQYLEKHKELVDLLGMDMIEKRIQSEQDGLTVYQYGYIFALEKRITELEKSQVVWHKYPDEKPACSVPDGYEENIPVMIYSMNGCVYFADYNTGSGNFWRYGGKENNVSHWAYLPEAPKVEK